MTVEAAIRLKGLPYERVDLPITGEHPARMQEIYGEGNTTVPGVLVDGEPIHGSRAILERLEAIEPEPALYPNDEVREAERWGDEELQDLGRRLPWGALHFRPELLAAIGGGEPLDGPGTDYAIRFIHGAWGYHRISAARLAEDLAGLPEKIAHIEELARSGVIGGEEPNAADLQIGATITCAAANRRPGTAAGGHRGGEDRAAPLPGGEGRPAAGRLSRGLGAGTRLADRRLLPPRRTVCSAPHLDPRSRPRASRAGRRRYSAGSRPGWLCWKASRSSATRRKERIVARNVTSARARLVSPLAL